MRKLSSILAGAALALGLAGPAHAVLTPFTGTLSVVLGTLPPIAVVATGTANVTASGGTITSFTLAGGTFATSVTIPVTDPAAAPISQVVAAITSGAGSFDLTKTGNINNNFVTNLSGQGSGAMKIGGTSKVGLFPGPLANISVPFTSGGVNGVGLGGNLVTASGFGVGISVRGAPWSVGTASIGTATVMGFNSGNNVQLVSPTFISTTIGASAVLPSFAVLTMTFGVVPEPATLLLLASGIAGLVLVGRKRLGE